jgi:hypothetical protein
MTNSKYQINYLYENQKKDIEKLRLKNI